MDEVLNALWNYHLPKQRIAQEPARPRSSARLLLYRRDRNTLEDRVCADLPDILNPRDLVVINDARVIPARLRGIRKNTGAKVEVFLLRQNEDGHWVAWVRSRHRLHSGEQVILRDGSLAIVGDAITPNGRERQVAFDPPLNRARLTEIGEMPTPPYIKKRLEHPDDYQTIFAKSEGALAAPTAGLHFDEALVDALTRKEIQFATTTLILGPGSFQLLGEEVPENLQLPPERVIVGDNTCEAILEAKRRGSCVLSVGTTVVRSLESAYLVHGRLAPFTGTTSLAIRPGFRFQVTDALMTNFHLPRSTHLLLVAAFIGVQETMRIYEHAIQEQYRFYSFGDALLVL